MLAVEKAGKGVHLTGWTQSKREYRAYKIDKAFDVECQLYTSWLDRLEAKRLTWVDPCLPTMQKNAWHLGDAKFDDDDLEDDLDDDDLDYDDLDY